MFPFHNIKNLVFQGGSVKGLAYVGAIGALEKNHFLDFNNLEKVGGTSAGAITALALALGKDTEGILDTVEVNFKEFIDAETPRKQNRILSLGNKSSIGQASNYSALASELSSKFGLCPGEAVRLWLEEIVAVSTQIPYCTFLELHEKVTNGEVNVNGRKFTDLYVVGFNLNLQRTTTFSWEHTPNAIISDAVRISMSIPFVFEPHQHYVKATESTRVLDESCAKDLWIDGGVTENYPIDLFDRDGEPNLVTLGFNLKSKKEAHQERLEIVGATDYIKAVVKSVLYQTQQRNTYERSNDSQRTIEIDPVGVKTMDFELSKFQKESLICSGWNSVVAKVKELDPNKVIAHEESKLVLNETSLKPEPEKSCTIS